LNNVVISEKMANRFFGTTDVVGRSLKVDNKEEYVITGVFQDLPQNSTLQFDWLAPFEIYLKKKSVAAAMGQQWHPYLCGSGTAR
jgi:hypothetical protein